MSARYMIKVAKELLDDLCRQPPTGWRIVSALFDATDPLKLGYPESIDVVFVEIEDENAPAALDGTCVDPILQLNHETGEVTVQSYGVSRPAT